MAGYQANYENAQEAVEKLKSQISWIEKVLESNAGPESVKTAWIMARLRFNQANHAIEGIDVI